jgi:hypothetical protein
VLYQLSYSRKKNWSSEADGQKNFTRQSFGMRRGKSSEYCSTRRPASHCRIMEASGIEPLTS